MRIEHSNGLEGYTARMFGHPIGACPYDPGYDAEDWLTGWETADAEVDW